MISVEHMDELITRFKSGELDIRDIIEQSYFGGREDAIEEYRRTLSDICCRDNYSSAYLLDLFKRIAEQLKKQK